MDRKITFSDPYLKSNHCIVIQDNIDCEILFSSFPYFEQFMILSTTIAVWKIKLK